MQLDLLNESDRTLSRLQLRGDIIFELVDVMLYQRYWFIGDATLPQCFCNRNKNMSMWCIVCIQNNTSKLLNWRGHLFKSLFIRLWISSKPMLRLRWRAFICSKDCNLLVSSAVFFVYFVCQWTFCTLDNLFNICIEFCLIKGFEMSSIKEPQCFPVCNGNTNPHPLCWNLATQRSFDDMVWPHGGTKY